MSVVTRIAPSPTGRMHIGTARSALFNYLWAKHAGGKFIVRIEDTDPARDKPEFEQDILENLAWLGIAHDEFYRQSENKARHAECIQQLIASGAAYVSKEPSKDDPTKEVELVRFKNPNKTVVFTDLLRGEIKVDTTDLNDFVIARSLTEPVHHLAVVVDDADEGVTLAMRGEDLLSNTPRQILIREALGLPHLDYIHLPLILAPDRTKLSKRRHAVSTTDYKARGYLAAGIVNYLALLGWNPGTEEEIFTVEELANRFELAQLQKSGAVFDEIKLNWVNRQHMLRMSVPDFIAYVKNFVSPETAAFLDTGAGEALVGVMRERASTFGDIREAEAAGEYAYFMKAPTYEAAKLSWKGTEPAEATAARLEAVAALLEPMQASQWSADSVKSVIWPYAEVEGRGQVLWPLRMALSGRDKSPDPFQIAGIIGRDETLARISAAVNLLRP